MYFIKAPLILQYCYPAGLVWRLPLQVSAPAVYLTFDDGPHIEATPFILDQLAAYHAKATFFCIGKNVTAHPDIYARILQEGHLTGNHTQHHLNGWKTTTQDYVADVASAAASIDSKLFRPPYGRISNAQSCQLQAAGYRIFMWDILSADFDIHISPGQCLDNVLTRLQPGSIVVFHDSAKAWDRMHYALPRVLEFCKQKNWALEALPAIH